MRERGHTDHDHGPTRYAAIPTRVRVEARGTESGRGITMAILDAGFREHEDLILPRNRIKAFRDLSNPGKAIPKAGDPLASEWHGTQTSVVAAGNGWLSDGLYSSLAPDVDLVLVKVGRDGRVTNDDLAQAFRWILRNRVRYRIRIVTLSVGGDPCPPGTLHEADRLANELARRGVVVIAAAGNGQVADGPSLAPPASAASVITVGGTSDSNRIGPLTLHSGRYGRINGRHKPELLAPAESVAAPILEGTAEARRALALTRLSAAPDYRIPKLFSELRTDSGLPEGLLSESIDELRSKIGEALRESKIASAHYQHAKGTSFAAPIVASLVAQMLEADPDLSADMVKRILLASASQVREIESEPQGFGVVDAEVALTLARQPEARPLEDALDPPSRSGETLTFRFHDRRAKSVHLVASFQGWDRERTSLCRGSDHVWRVQVDAPTPGRHAYKFLIDGQTWLNDPLAFDSEPDGHGGRNSVLPLDDQGVS